MLASVVLMTGQAVAQTTTGYRAVIRPQSAIFTFPLPAFGEWEWNLPHTAPNASEYRWEVRGNAGGEKYSFGFYRFRHGSSVPMRGSFGELLESGQLSFWVSDANGGMRVDPEIDVLVAQETGQLVIRLEARDAIERVFSNRPDSVVLTVQLRGGQPADRAVSVTYLTEAPAGPAQGTRSPSLPTGSFAPDFSLPVLAVAPRDEARGSRRTLSSHRGEIVVLSFWTTGCPVCIREYPELVELAEEWAPRGVRLYGIVVGDSRSNVEAFLRRHGGARFTHLAGDVRTEGAFGGYGVPYLVIVDADGRIAYRRFGGVTRLSAAVSPQLTRLLDERHGRE